MALLIGSKHIILNPSSHVIHQKPVNFLKKMSVDFGLILPVMVVVYLLEVYFKPFHRGFFCSDTSIRYPLKQETVGRVSLYLISLAFPVIFLGMGEILFASEEDYEGDINHLIGKWRVHKGFVRTYDISVSFLFGFLVCLLIVVMSTHTLGKMRPNFFEACNPNVTCPPDKPTYTYHENYICKNETTEIYSRLSFPSKHTTLCFYTMVYLSVYLQNKVRWDYLSVFNNCMQVTFMIVAWIVAITQMTDYFHHLEDIIAGIIIGSLVAWFNVCAVYNFFKQRLRIDQINQNE
uniref:Putative phosphatidate phosphatase n=1 Tax=Lygus hesperus TaxID=30085 RepID=A0A0A9XMZ3_LYGHE